MNFSSSRSSFIRSRNKQQGNTFIGIVIGLVIGLSIAVVVALMITKGSTPFTDKGHPSKATEPTAGQIADPNKPMYGNKDAAREAAKDLKDNPPPAPAPAAPAPSAADQLQAVVDKIQATPAHPAKPAPAVPNASNVTPQPAAKAAAAAAAAAADTGDDKFIYYLQAGAFREVADAENARAKLALLGFEANISDRSTDTGVLHRVRVGPYHQVEAMNKARGKLSENGIDVAVVRNQK